MKMTKPNDADFAMAFELADALESLCENHDSEAFSLDDEEQCRRVCEYLIRLTRSASLGRIVMGMSVVCDPDNEVIDPDSDVLELHPKHRPPAARPLAEWHEDDGPVVWWRFPVEEPAWIGTPLDEDWPGDHTHWTPHPAAPKEPTA